MVLKGLLGLIVGSGYGLIVGALAFLSWRLLDDPAHPGPMIPDRNGWAQLVTVFATVIAGVCGALVGMVVGLSGANKVRAGTIGGGVGLVLFLLFSANLSSGLTNLSWREWQALLGVSFIFLLFLPIGLGLTGIAASIVVGKFRP